MIRISCTNCKTVLSIDDAFAGGVCRCQHCGTIQTVPAHARDTAAVGAPVGQSGQAMGGSKAIFQHGARSGTGLDDLANIVASSGLSSQRLTKKPASQKPKPNMLPLMIGGGIVMAILVVVIVVLVMHMSPGTSAASGGSGHPSSPGGANPTEQPTANAPSFCGTKLDGNAVVYLLDCGSSTGDYIGDIRNAVIKSLESIGSDRKFQVLFWNDGSEGAYPAGSVTFAAKDSIDAARTSMESVIPNGASDIQPSLKLALMQHPDEIVIVTAKGWQLSSEWADAVMATRGASPVKLITYSLGSPQCAPLERVATATGGSYHELSKGELHNFAE